MSQQLISHNADLKRLRDEGYEIEIKGGYLVAHHIPYVNSDKTLKFGILLCSLDHLTPTTLDKPHCHVIQFAGSHPCDVDGKVMTCIQYLTEDRVFVGITTNHSFSNKPSAGYENYYEKVRRYADIISAPAKYLYPGVTEKTFKVIQCDNDSGVFHYVDTNSSRANIDALNNKLAPQKIAIIGLGGTGSYLLDLVSKTNVAEIHIYDGDQFSQHNAFRAPGACSVDDLEKNYSKVDYLYGIYSKLRKYIFAHNYYVNEDNLLELDNKDFVFLAVDNNTARYMIANYLNGRGIPFIDVGLGVQEIDGCITGLIRTSTVTKDYNEHMSRVIPSVNNDNNDYVTNIQIAELNAFNATLAVIKWKKFSGFYADLNNEHNSIYLLNTNKIINDDIAT